MSKFSWKIVENTLEILTNSIGLLANVLFSSIMKATNSHKQVEYLYHKPDSSSFRFAAPDSQIQFEPGARCVMLVFEWL